MSEKPVTPFRHIMATLVLGAALGACATLISLKVMGVRLEPGLNNPAFNKFFQVYHDLHDQYFKSESDATLLNGAVDGMTKSLGDPFTDYFPPADATQFHNMLSGSYVGIGVSIQQVDGGTQIVGVTKATPAEKAGLRVQDVIVAVDGKSVVNMPLQQVNQLVVGPEGTKVTLTVKRPGAANHLLKFTITRAKISRSTVYTKMLTHDVGYLQISVVADKTAAEVSTALTDLKKAGAKKLVLDLRGNPGGYLDQAVKIAGDFIPSGKTVVQTVGRDGKSDKTASPGPGGSMPVVVIMDNDTASAAEILAGALHEDLGVALVGTKSFGKGTVQESDGFADGSTLKYTIAKWLTPNGEWIHGKGLTPTVSVNLPSWANLSPITQAKLPLHANQNAPDVTLLQQMLDALGIKVDRTDGYYDDSTARAVQSFQRSHRLTVTGTVDTSTARALQADFDALLAKSDTQLEKAEQLLATQNS